MKYKIDNFELKGLTFYRIEIYLPKTTLLVVGNEVGYFMCGALDVDVFESSHLKERGVICGRAKGVKTIEELLNAELEKITSKAKEKGIFKGMLVKDALLMIS